MSVKVKLKKGDTVLVIAGNNKGSKGEVKRVDLEKNRVYVEGVNMVKRHTKPTTAQPDGKIVEKEAGIHISNVMLLVGETPTRVGRKLDETSGKLVRYSKKTGEVIK
jgi:large subunit ribosomal protein L24